MGLAEELRKWRGGRCQKQVNDLFGVSLSVYRTWEQGARTPTELTEKQIRFIMQTDSAGISAEVLIQHYWRVIKQVAAEIQNRK